MESNITTGLLSHIQPLTILYVLLAIPPLYYLLLRPLYNLSPLHPLASYPGPLWSRASPLPHAWRIASGRGARAVAALHERYGPVVRLGPGHLSFVDVRAWRDVYGLGPVLAGKGDGAGNGKGKGIGGGGGGGGGGGALDENPKSRVYHSDSIGGESAVSMHGAPRVEHARLRRALAPGFSERAVRSQEAVIRGYVDLLVRGLREDGVIRGKKVDLVERFTWMAFDVVGDLVFAEPFGCLRGKRGHAFVDMVTGLLDQTAWLLALRYAGLSEWRVVRAALKSLLFWLAGDAVARLKEAMVAKLKHRLDVKGVRDDLFEGLIQKRKEWNLDLDRLESNASFLVVAGSETTATLLSGVTYLLLQNPNAMAKLKHEIRSSFSSPDEITIATVSRLPFLLACLNEALRLCPPAPNNFAREVRRGGAVIAGRFVPEKTIVEVQQYAINHSSQHWHDPFVFQPERFLHESNDESGDRLEALQPFSVGPRDCIGRNLAYAEMRLVLARMLFEFDLELADESKDWMNQSRIYTVWLKAPLYIHVAPVERS